MKRLLSKVNCEGCDGRRVLKKKPIAGANILAIYILFLLRTILIFNWSKSECWDLLSSASIWSCNVLSSKIIIFLSSFRYRKLSSWNWMRDKGTYSEVNCESKFIALVDRQSFTWTLGRGAEQCILGLTCETARGKGGGGGRTRMVRLEGQNRLTNSYCTDEINPAGCKSRVSNNNKKHPIPRSIQTVLPSDETKQHYWHWNWISESS